jgi:hypothetical protein
MTDDVLNYHATDTACGFHNDDSFVRLLLGPVGCGKSVACCVEPLIRGIQQAPGRDGIRRTRGAVIRNTYPELKSTTIKTWLSWYPEKKFGKIKWDSPITQLIKFNDVEIEVLFMPMDSIDDVEKLMSLELTWAYINEVQFIPKKIFKICQQRVNRYPSKKDGAELSWTGVFADTNPPDADHWIFKMFEEKIPNNHRIFRYDSPLIKYEELPKDLHNIALSMDGTAYSTDQTIDYIDIQNDPNYWLNLVPGSTDEEIKVNLMGKYGIVVDGKPVHATYNDTIHFANKEITASPLVELGLGWDFGLTPACAIVQLSPHGQLVALDELWTEDMDLRDFAENVVIPHLDRNYPWWRDNYISVNDPAGSAGMQTDGASCEDILLELKIKSNSAAPNNNPTPRRDGLKYFLGRLTGGKPAFVVSNKCTMIRKGLMGNFQYGRIKVGGEERYHEKPLKNIYSHICEGLEYIAMHYSAENKKSTPKEGKSNRIRRVPFMAL